MKPNRNDSQWKKCKTSDSVMTNDNSNGNDVIVL